MKLQFTLLIAMTCLAASSAWAGKVALLEVSKGQLPTDWGSNMTKFELEDNKELGGQSLKVTYASGDRFGDTVSTVKNWKQFSALEFTAFNPVAGSVKLILRVKHRGSTSYESAVSVPIVLKTGKNDVRVRIGEMMNADGTLPELSEVIYWHLRCEPDTAPTIYFGDFWLNTDDVPEVSATPIAAVHEPEKPVVAKNPEPVPAPAVDTQHTENHPAVAAIKWKLIHEEHFNEPFKEPADWVEDTYYGKSNPYRVDMFDEVGDYFRDISKADFLDQLHRFRAFRKSFTYGQDGWLTVELYGRDSDKDGIPETGGRFVSENGKAKLICSRPWDAAILRSTKPLPRRYRIEIKISNINFGGEKNGRWVYDGKVNGYKERSYYIAGPWHNGEVVSANGVYFLCITDYPNPAPHNNIFLHHHRKVVMDTCNNNSNLMKPTGGAPWSSVWNPKLGAPRPDGSHYVSMIWARGDDFGTDRTGNEFLSYTPGGWKNGPIFADKYLDGETYTFSVERDGESYTMSVSGKFFYGGETTYTGSHKFRDDPVVWHYNQTADEYQPPAFNQTRTYQNRRYDTWPEGSSYPDYFFVGDPHINYYEGTAEYDDFKLYVPED